MSWPTPGVVRLIDAMVVAEGGDAAMVRAVQISVPTCGTIAEARVIAANTIAHALWDYVRLNHQPGMGIEPSFEDFVAFLGSRWAPVGAENDPTNLNANWVPNVLAHLSAHGGAIA